MPSGLVGTLRVHGGDPSAAARELGRVSLRPESMPARAVLIVRHLDDPLPGVLGIAASSSAWERAVRSALDARLRDAARSSAGPVPADATAVLFEDPAQLLAALAADWVAGSAGSRWWWREFTRSRTVADAVVGAWVREARAVPAALGLLAHHGSAVTFVRALPPPAVSSLTAAVLHAWGAPETAAVVVHHAADVAAADGRPASAAPWASWAAEAVNEGLATAAQVLLGVGLSLARAPAITSRPGFWASVLTWLEARTHAVPPEAGTPHGRAHRPGTHPVVTRGAAPAHEVGDATKVAAEERAAPDAQAADGVPGAERTRQTARLPQRGRAGASPADDPTRSGPGSVRRLPSSGAPGRMREPYPPEGQADGTGWPRAPGGRVGDRRRGQPSPIPAPCVIGSPALTQDAVPAPAPAADAKPMQTVAVLRVDTAYAGLFFLLNVALGAGLYADFTRPATPGIPLSPWHLLALLGEQMLYPGAKPARPDDDPVWALLARLAEPTEPGTADRPAPPVVPRAMRRWVCRLSWRLRAELGLALGCAPDAVAGVLLRRPGRVEATATRVDVVLSLTDLPIAVRLAGLDRDPGWIPAAGRTVTFHFE